MTPLKTQANNKDVLQFLESVAHPRRRADSLEIHKLMQEISGEEAQMWGSSIVGFGRYRYKYASGREGEWFLTGFSPRKQNLTLYIMTGFKGSEILLRDIGKHKTGKACLYINKLEDINMEVLRTLIQQSIAVLRANEQSTTQKQQQNQ